MKNLLSRPDLIAMLVEVLSLIGAGILVVTAVSVVVMGRAYASPPNLVEVPEYSRSKADVEDVDPRISPEPKSQYLPDPDNEEMPVLHKLMRGQETADGAEYAEADELVVEPESESISISTSPIREVDLNQPMASPRPSPSP